MGSTPQPSKKSCHAALCSSMRSFKWSTAAKLNRKPPPLTSSSESLRHCWVWSAFHKEMACLVVSLRRIQTKRRRLGSTEAGTSHGRTSASAHVGRAPKRVPARRMLGVPATVLAQNVSELGIVEQRPHLRVVGALEVVPWLPGLPRLEQDLEVLLRVTRYPRVVERRTKQRAPATRRRTDQIRQRRLGEPDSSTHKPSSRLHG